MVNLPIRKALSMLGTFFFICLVHVRVFKTGHLKLSPRVNLEETNTMHAHT